MLVGTVPLCGNLSALPSTPLLLRSAPWLRSSLLGHPQSPLVKGLPSMWKPFLLHSSLPPVQVPSLFFCLCFFFFLLPYPVTWGVSCLLGGLRSSASIQWVFYRSSSTCRCTSDVSVGRKVISASYSSTIFSSSVRVLESSRTVYQVLCLNGATCLALLMGSAAGQVLYLSVTTLCSFPGIQAKLLRWVELRAMLSCAQGYELAPLPK